MKIGDRVDVVNKDGKVKKLIIVAIYFCNKVMSFLGRPTVNGDLTSFTEDDIVQ